MVLPANRLLNPTNQKRLASWKAITSIQLKPKGDADITKVLFAQFKWVVYDKLAPREKDVAK